MKTFVGVLKKGKLDISGVPEYLKTLPDGVVLMRVELIEEIIKHRKQYFAIIDEVCRITGYSKGEIHDDMIKKEVLPQITEKTTTKELILDEWPVFIEAVKEYFYLKLDLVV